MQRALLLTVALLVVGVHPGLAQRLTLQRDLVIGAVNAEPELEFQNISAIGVSNDGTMYVADGGSRSIRVFNDAGKFVRQWGRRGDGPGEFQFISNVLFQGDTVFIVDSRQMRVTAFTREGAVIATWRTGPTQLNQAVPLAAVSNGWIMQASETPRAWVDAPPKAGEVRNLVVRLGQVRELGTQPDSLRELASYVAQHWIGVQVGGRPVQERPLFEPVPDHAVDSRGLIYLSRAESYRIDVIDPNGKAVRTLSRRYDPIEITRAMVSRYRSNVNQHFDTVSAATMVQPQMRNIARLGALARADLPMPRAIPPLGQLFVSPGGVVWVTRIDQYAQPVDTYFSRAPKQPQPWDVFDASGVFIGSAQTPANFTLRSVTEREIIGIERGELDVQYVVRYRFR